MARLERVAERERGLGLWRGITLLPHQYRSCTHSTLCDAKTPRAKSLRRN
jgi:hypothetical protein